MYIHKIFDEAYVQLLEITEEVGVEHVAKILGFEYESETLFSSDNIDPKEDGDPDYATLEAVAKNWNPEPPAHYFLAAKGVIDNEDCVRIMALFVKPKTDLAHAIVKAYNIYISEV